MCLECVCAYVRMAAPITIPISWTDGIRARASDDKTVGHTITLLRGDFNIARTGLHYSYFKVLRETSVSTYFAAVTQIACAKLLYCRERIETFVQRKVIYKYLVLLSLRICVT